MSNPVSNSKDFIDSRDVQERIDELESERSSLDEKVQEMFDALNKLGEDATDEQRKEAQEAFSAATTDLNEFDEGEDATELKALLALREEAQNATSEWEDGATLIRESYFEEYCQEECEYLGYISKDLPSFIEIDWEATADNMKQDYSEVDFDGEAYLVRDS